jgi:peptide/nickel transport system substrate-binding protein
VKRVTRRQLLVLMSGGTAGLALAACAPIQPPAPTPPPAPKPTEGPSQGPSSTAPKPAAAPTTAPAKPAEAKPEAAKPTAQAAPAAQPTAAAKTAGSPKKGGVFRATQLFDVIPRNPHIITFQNQLYYPQVFDTLIRYDLQLNPQPSLATSWEFTPDARGLRFTLRDDVVFHTGRPFTAEDVAWNIERIRDPKVSSQMRSYVAMISEVKAPDKTTLELTFDRPVPGMLDLFDGLYIADRETIADLEESRRAVGTGPFVWEEWRQGERMTLKRWDRYWKQGLPHLDGVEVRVVPDAQASLAALEAGASEMAVNPIETDIPRIRENRDLQALVSESGSQFYYVGANVASPPLDNKKLRQAISYAIDRKRFVDTSLAGIGDPYSVPWPKNSPAFDEEQNRRYDYNLERARALVKESGVPEGTELIFQPNGGFPALVNLAEIMRGDLEKIGLRLKIEVLESALWLQNLTGRTFKHLWDGTIGFMNTHPASLFIQAFPVRVGANSSNYESPEYARLVEQVQTAVSPADLKRAAHAVTELFLDEAFSMPVTPNKRAWGMRGYVQGVEYNMYDRILLENAWLDK